MPEIAQHLLRRRLDIQLRRRHAQGPHQSPGVRLRVIGGGKPRHGKGQDIRPRQVQPVEGLSADDQRLGRIQPAGNPDHHPFDPRRPQPLREAGDLDVVGLVTILLQTRDVGRHEGEALDRAAEADIGVGRVQPEADPPPGPGMAAAVGVEGAHLQPLLPQQVQVDIGDRRLVRRREAFGLGQGGAVFEHAGLAVPGEVGGGLPCPGCRVQVCRQAARGLRATQQPPRFGLGDGDVAGGQVGQHGGAGDRRLTAGRVRDPDVLANLRVDNQVRQVLRGEQQVGAEGHLATPNCDRAALMPVAGDEMARFVELPVVRQVDFRHHAEQPAAMDRQRAIVQRTQMPQWRAHQH